MAEEEQEQESGRSLYRARRSWRAQFFSVIHSIVARIHRVSTGESIFALVVYFDFDNISKSLQPFECLAI
jgi:hypothetical protein